MTEEAPVRKSKLRRHHEKALARVVMLERALKWMRDVNDPYAAQPTDPDERAAAWRNADAIIERSRRK